MNIPPPFLNFLNLLKYGLISQLLYFLTIPIILKQYNSTEYGIFTITFSIASVIGTLSALRLERAIVVEDINSIKALLVRCFFYVIISSFFCFLVLFYALKPFNLSADENSLLVICGSIYCLLFGFQQILIHLAIRQDTLMITGVADVIYSFLLVVFLLVLPNDLYKQSIILLVIFLVSRLISLLPFLTLNIKHYWKIKNLSVLTFKELGKYHIPVLTVLLSNIQFKGLFYLTGIHYGGSVTGQLSMSQRVVYAPINLIGAALRKSFFLEFTKLDERNESINTYIHKILNFGSIISIIVLPFFLLSLDYIKPHIPEGWEASIPFAIALYPVASILALLSWLDRLYDAKKKQAVALFYELVYTVILYSSLSIALYIGVSALVLLLCFTTITVFYNLLWASFTLKMIEANHRTVFLPAFLHVLILIFCVLYLR